MIKLNASYSKKVPAQEKYSSESYLACVEVELPTGASSDELQARIHETFELVKQAVEAEISGQTSNHQAHKPQRSQQASESPMKASNKQIKFILDLGKAKEKGLAELNAETARLYGCETIYELSKKDASRFVDVLKAA